MASDSSAREPSSFQEEQAKRLEMAKDTLYFLRSLAGERRFVEIAEQALPLAVSTRNVDELHLYSVIFRVLAESDALRRTLAELGSDQERAA